LDEARANKIRTNGETESRYVIDEVVYRIKGAAKTTLTDPVRTIGAAVIHREFHG